MPESTENPPRGNLQQTTLNPLLHEPARLSLLAALTPADYVDFATLLQLTGASKSSLSKHLSTLTGAGIVEVTPGPSDRRGRRVAFTPYGRTSFEEYLRNLETLLRSARN
ncbi:transcriptional regulator [Leucobacter tardus]|uniref:Transcriptional regulator n=1 Tax=Leucobacter tardus TaxID=501483 RepID=A0A939TQ91_9MICO|nr:transcriptional regulator [Leucobacter tardus]